MATRNELSRTQETAAFSEVTLFVDAYLDDHAAYDERTYVAVRKPGSERITRVDLPAIVDTMEASNA